jgi:hypothetical protein
MPRHFKNWTKGFHARQKMTQRRGRSRTTPVSPFGNSGLLLLARFLFFLVYRVDERLHLCSLGVLVQTAE